MIKGLSTFTITGVIVIGYMFLIGIINPNLLIETLPEFIGGTLGILLGFGFYELIGDMRADKDKKQIKQNLKDELEKGLELCKMMKSYLLPTAFWRATLSTGDLSLLPFDQRKSISSIYTIIENQNYESTQVKNANINYNIGMVGATATLNAGPVKAGQYLNKLITDNKKRELETTKQIEMILKEEWWV